MKIRKELNKRLYEQKMYGCEKSPYCPDRTGIRAITDGDMDRLKELFLSEKMNLLKEKRTLSDNKLKNIKYRFVIAAAQIAAAGIDSGMGHDESCTIADIYSRKADRSAACEDVQLLFEEMCLDYAERMLEIRKQKAASVHVRKCIDHIYEDLGADLSVRELAFLTGLNESYLSRLFKQETGMTIKDFVTAAKMDTAQNLLRYSELSSAVIAASLGYSSQSAFTYAFRRFTGTTPKKYRTENSEAAFWQTLPY